MKLSLLVAVLAGLSVISVGCKKETPPPSTTSAQKEAADKAAAEKLAADKLAADKAAAEKLAADKLAAEKAAAEKAAADKLAAEKAAAEAAKTKEAQSLLDQIIQYIKDNKFDLAEQGLQKLDGMQGLPASLTDKIKAAKTSLTAAKAVGGVKMP